MQQLNFQLDMQPVVKHKEKSFTFTPLINQSMTIEEQIKQLEEKSAAELQAKIEQLHNTYEGINAVEQFEVNQRQEQFELFKKQKEERQAFIDKYGSIESLKRLSWHYSGVSDDGIWFNSKEDMCAYYLEINGVDSIKYDNKNNRLIDATGRPFKGKFNLIDEIGNHHTITNKVMFNYLQLKTNRTKSLEMEFNLLDD